MSHKCETCDEAFSSKKDLNKHKLNCEMDNQRDKYYSSLINIFKSCTDIIRNSEKSIVGEEALRNMSYLITLKLIEKYLDNEIKIDEHKYDLGEKEQTKLLEIVRFSNLLKEEEQNLAYNIQALWDGILSEHPATNKIFIKGGKFDIKKCSTFKKLLKKIDELPDTNYDILGNAYEEIIKDTTIGRDLGQFFTQPLVKKIMLDLIKPVLYEDGKIDTCADPTMGSGGFLISYIKEINKQSQETGIPIDWEYVKRRGLYGKEVKQSTYQLAVSNMLISTGHYFENSLYHGDSLEEPIARKFDCILANPPFSIKIDYDSYIGEYKNSYIPIKTKSSELLFLQVVIYMLKKEGRCAIVMPDGEKLFGKNKDFVATREYLFKTCDLQEIVYLPQGIFNYTTIKTCIFYFIKKIEGSEIVKTNIKNSKKTQKETGRDYKFSKKITTNSVKFYESDGETKKLLVEVSAEDISKNFYSLNYNDYLEKEEKTEHKEGVEIKTLGEVCEINIGGTPSRDINEYYENGNNLWLSVKELNGGYIYDTKEKITDKGVKNSSVKLFKENTVLFSFKLSIGKMGIVGKPLYTNEAIAGLNSKNTEILTNKYLYHYLNNTDFSKSGSGILGNGSMNKTSLGEIKIPIPSLEKQQQIVEYLDYIYEKANKTSEEKIKELKKLNEQCINFQKIIRTNEVKTLGEVCEFKNGKCLTRDKMTEGIYPVIGGGKFPSGYHNNFNTDENIILCSSSGAYAGYISRYNIKSWASDCFSIKSKDNNIVDNNYLYYYLINNQEEIYKLQNGMAQPHVYSKDVSNLKFLILSLEKQQKIVKYCDNNCKLIEYLEKEIENNKLQGKNFLSDII